jgi:hypothetical protein
MSECLLAMPLRRHYSNPKVIRAVDELYAHLP